MGNSLSTREVEELSRLCKFDKDEIRQHHTKFVHDFPSGRITLVPFTDRFALMFPLGEVRDYATHVFRTFDKDGNGSIDFKEYITTLSIFARGNIDEKLSWAFEMYDLDKNRRVSYNEARQIISAVFMLRGAGENPDMNKIATQLFADAGKDPNREEITKTEFIFAVRNSVLLKTAILQPIWYL